MSLFQDGGGQAGRKRFSRGQMFQLRPDGRFACWFWNSWLQQREWLGKIKPVEMGRRWKKVQCYRQRYWVLWEGTTNHARSILPLALTSGVKGVSSVFMHTTCQHIMSKWVLLWSCLSWFLPIILYFFLLPSPFTLQYLWSETEKLIWKFSKMNLRSSPAYNKFICENT